MQATIRKEQKNPNNSWKYKKFKIFCMQMTFFSRKVRRTYENKNLYKK